jgi:hypothetical protein
MPMSDAMLFERFNSLPENMKSKVADLIVTLEKELKSAKKIKERQFGIGKGSFEMAPDFNQPLDDFKDYM